MNDRRGDEDRRDNPNQVTLMEVYRLLQRVSGQVSDLDEKIAQHETDIALLKDRSGIARTMALGGLLAVWSTFLAWAFHK